MTLQGRQHPARDLDRQALRLGVTVEAARILADSPFIDAHCDMDVPARVLGWRQDIAHGPWRRVVPMMCHTDLPRLMDAGMTGVVYDIATNVLRSRASRLEITLANLERVEALVQAHPEELVLARNAADHDRAVATGRLAVWIALQGGNALEADPDILDGHLGRRLHRITLVHLTSSVFAGSNSPRQPDLGLSGRGRAFVAACNHNRVLVDLSHAARRSFWDVLEVHDPTVPPIVSHTGMDAVRSHWRNIDDAQIKAIATRGGVVGVIYQGAFLTQVPLGFACRRAHVLDHLEHLIDVGGEDVAAIGTDYDGMITPPSDLTDVTHHPQLVQDMLDRGWGEPRIRKVLGENYLRVVRDVCPGGA